MQPKPSPVKQAGFGKEEQRSEADAHLKAGVAERSLRRRHGTSKQEETGFDIKKEAGCKEYGDHTQCIPNKRRGGGAGREIRREDTSPPRGCCRCFLYSFIVFIHRLLEYRWSFHRVFHKSDQKPYRSRFLCFTAGVANLRGDTNVSQRQTCPGQGHMHAITQHNDRRSVAFVHERAEGYHIF